MPRPARPWFRFYVEAMRDPKMRRLTPSERWLWVAILAAARESATPGTLYIAAGVPMSWDDLADYAGMKLREVEQGTDRMSNLGMLAFDGVAWSVPAWNDRQYESDNTTERTRKHRSQEQGRNVPTTPVGTPPDTETDTETESDERRKRRPPSDFVPTDEHRTFATASGLDLDGELEHWILDCEAKNRTYAKLNAGFSTWLRQAVNFGRGAKPPVANGHKLDPPRVPLEPIVRCAKCGFLVCQCKGKARMPAELAERVGVKREVS